MSSALDVPAARTLVLDANILIRAVLGRRVLGLLTRYAGRIRFVAPEEAYGDAQSYLPGILVSKSLAHEAALVPESLERLTILVTPIPHATYANEEQAARARLKGRDEDDWPVMALALTLRCPIWTEDADFFGGGVATWTTDRVELYLAAWRAGDD